MKKTFVVRTQYDGEDYRSVEEISFYDENGDEKVDLEVTALCLDISTCADQGVDTWTYLKYKIQARLQKAGIAYEDIEFEDRE
ncbi:hypothetical protein CEC48_04500 [Pseudomonas sp. K2I15]|nr:hypothetical protein CEC48_04500 [Pseudomonas sp. K2I15]